MHEHAMSTLEREREAFEALLKRYGLTNPRLFEFSDDEPRGEPNGYDHGKEINLLVGRTRPMNLVEIVRLRREADEILGNSALLLFDDTIHPEMRELIEPTLRPFEADVDRPAFAP